MSRRLVLAAAAGAIMVAAACGNPPTRSSIPAPLDLAESAGSDPTFGAEGLTTVPQTTQAARATEVTDTATGLIAAAGPTGLRVLRSNGDVVAEMASDHMVTQPTWSRDGRRLAATLQDSTSGAFQVAVIDTATWEVTTEAAKRPYFFYTWSHDGSRLAALGPSSSGGTALDILDGTGTPTSTESLLHQSIFVAWDPGGHRLLLHTGSQLLLVNDPDSPADFTDLGIVGADFQAPAWVPGTGDFLYVDSADQTLSGSSQPELPEGQAPTGPRLLRRGADSGEITNLGPVSGFSLIAVHPDGNHAALSLPPPLPPDPLGGLDAVALGPTAALSASASPSRTGALSASASPSRTGALLGRVQGSSGSVQIVDLASGERLTVLDRQGLWLEWSPDGRLLLMAAFDPQSQGNPGLTWHVWDGEESNELARFTPTEAFVRNYVAFADQYTETPRLWSPDSTAITFGTLTANGAAAAIARHDNIGQVISLGPADVSFWSPAVPGLSSPETQ